MLGFSTPETRRLPMERMEELFERGRHWWMGWKATLDWSAPSAALGHKLDDQNTIDASTTEKHNQTQEQVDRV